MLSTNRRGNILIFLVIILFMSSAVLLLAKSFSQSQASVETAISSRYQTALSAQMDPPEKWAEEENSRYKFKFHYPSQWVGGLNPKSTGDKLYTIEKFLSRKIKLKVVVFANLEIPQDAIAMNLESGKFYLLEDKPTTKTAAHKGANYHYKIELTQDGYFADELEFRGTFFQILKKFESPQK